MKSRSFVGRSGWGPSSTFSFFCSSLISSLPPRATIAATMDTSDLVVLPAVMFTPWVFAIIALVRWKRHAKPGDPAPRTARVALAVMAICLTVSFAIAAQVFGGVVWFLFGLLVWALLSWALYQGLMSGGA